MSPESPCQATARLPAINKDGGEVGKDATGVSHIAICVADIDRSLGFYRDILGMTVGLDL